MQNEETVSRRFRAHRAILHSSFFILPWFQTFLRKYAIVSVRPSASFTFGSHFRIFLALVMSGLRCFGSSCGSGLKMILLFDFVARIICSANCSIVISVGLPMFTGKSYWLIIKR